MHAISSLVKYCRALKWIQNCNFNFREILFKKLYASAKPQEICFWYITSAPMKCKFPLAKCVSGHIGFFIVITLGLRCREPFGLCCAVNEHLGYIAFKHRKISKCCEIPPNFRQGTRFLPVKPFWFPFIFIFLWVLI